jgi:hypothetical protein
MSDTGSILSNDSDTEYFPENFLDNFPEEREDSDCSDKYCFENLENDNGISSLRPYL